MRCDGMWRLMRMEIRGRQAGFLIALVGRSPLLYTVEHLGSLGCSFLANLDYHLFSHVSLCPCFFSSLSLVSNRWMDGWMEPALHITYVVSSGDPCSKPTRDRSKARATPRSPSPCRALSLSLSANRRDCQTDTTDSSNPPFTPPNLPSHLLLCVPSLLFPL
jgi:hypothetical protein